MEKLHPPTTAGSGSAGDGAPADPKAEKELEKARKAAVKELTSVYKAWAQLFKSKDVKQMALVGEQFHDDVFLLGGGGMAALVKALSFKDTDPKSIALHCTMDALCVKYHDEFPDDVYAPSIQCTTRCVSFVQHCMAAGYEMCGMAPLVAAIGSTDPQHQLLALRTLRGIAAAIVSINATDPLASASVTPSVVDVRTKFLEELLANESFFRLLLSLLQAFLEHPSPVMGSESVASVPVSDAPGAKKGSKEKVAATPSWIGLLEVLRILRIVFAACKQQEGVPPLALSQYNEDRYLKSEAPQLWVEWLYDSNVPVPDAMAAAARTFTSRSTGYRLPNDAVLSSFAALLRLFELNIPEPSMKFTVHATVIGCLTDALSLSDSGLHLEAPELAAALENVLKHVSAGSGYVSAAIAKVVNEAQEATGRPASPSSPSPTREDDKAKPPAKLVAKSGVTGAAGAADDAKLPMPSLGAELLAHARHELSAWRPVNNLRVVEGSHSQASERTKLLYAEAVLLEVYRSLVESMQAVYRWVLRQYEGSKHADLLPRHSVFSCIEKLHDIVKLPYHANKASLVRSIGNFTVMLASLDDTFRVFAAGLGTLQTWVRILGLEQVDDGVRSHVAWSLHNHSAAATVPFTYTCLADKVPCEAKPVRGALSKDGGEPAGPEAVRHQADAGDPRARPIAEEESPSGASMLTTSHTSNCVSKAPVFRRDVDVRMLVTAADDTVPPDVLAYWASKTAAAVQSESSVASMPSAKGKQAVPPPSSATVETPVEKFAGPWLPMSEVLALCCAGYPASSADAVEAQLKPKAKGEAKGGKTGAGEAAPVANPFDSVTAIACKPLSPFRGDLLSAWPDRLPFPALHLSTGPAFSMSLESVSGSLAKDASTVRKPPATTGAKGGKKDAEAPPSPRSSHFPASMHDQKQAALHLASPFELRLHGMRLLSTLVGIADEDLIASQAVGMVARVLVDSVVSLSALARSVEASRPQGAKVQATSQSPRSPASGRRGSMAEGSVATTTSSTAMHAPEPLASEGVHLEIISLACLVLACLIPSSAKAVDQTQVLGPILWDSLLAVALPTQALCDMLFWAKDVLEPARLQGHLQHASAEHTDLVMDVPLWDARLSRFGSPVPRSHAAVNVRELSMELLRRGALLDNLFRVYDWSQPSVPLPAPEGGDATAATKDAKAGKALGGPGASKDKKGAVKGSNKDAASEPTQPVSVSSIVKPMLSAPLSLPVVGVDWDCKTESIGARISACILRLVPMLAHALGQPILLQPGSQGSAVTGEGADVAGKQRMRAGVLRVIHAAFSAYRARDKLVAEQVRMFFELRAAQQLASRKGGDAGGLTDRTTSEDRNWERVADTMNASRTEHGVFLYGTHGVLVLGSSRSYTFAVAEDMDALGGATKKGGGAEKARAKGDLGLDDPFAAKRASVHPVECWFGGPVAESGLLAAGLTKLPSIHGFDRLVNVGTGYTPYGPVSHALALWQQLAAADSAAEPQTSRDKSVGKPSTGTGKRGAAVSVAEVAPDPSEDRVLVVGEHPVVPSRLFVPSVAVAQAAQDAWNQTSFRLSSPDPGMMIKSASVPLEDGCRILAKNIVADVRSLDAMAPLAQLAPTCSEYLAACIFGQASAAVIAPLHALASLVTDACATNEELLLSVSAAVAFCSDTHRGAATQSVGSETASAFLVANGALVGFEGLAALAALPEVGYALDAVEVRRQARFACDWLRDRWLQRSSFWGRRLVRGSRTFTPEEQSAVDAAGSMLVVNPPEGLPEGIVSVNPATNSLEEDSTVSLMATVPSSRGATTSPALQAWAARWSALLNVRAASVRYGYSAMTPLHAATAGFAGAAVVRAYLAVGAECDIEEQDAGLVPLCTALLSSQHEIVRTFIEHGANVNHCDHFGNPVLKYAFCVLPSESVRSLVATEDSMSCMATQCARQRALALQRGIALETSFSPQAASAEAVQAAVADLLAHGASPNVPDDTGASCVQWAAAGTFLDHSGCKVLSTQISAFCFLPADTSREVLRAIAMHGGDVDYRNAVGSTALHVALENGNLGSTWQLLQLGATPTVLDGHRRTPLHVAAAGHGAGASVDTWMSIYAALASTSIGRCFQPPGVPAARSAHDGKTPFDTLVDAIFAKQGEARRAHEGALLDLRTYLHCADSEGKTCNDDVEEISLAGVAQGGGDGVACWELPATSKHGQPMVMHLCYRYMIPVEEVRCVCPKVPGEPIKYVLPGASRVTSYQDVESHEAQIRTALRNLWNAMDTAGVPVEGAVGFTPLNVAAGKDPVLSALDGLSREWHERSVAVDTRAITHF